MNKAWLLGPILCLLGCGAESSQMAGGSSEQGNALTVRILSQDGKPAAGILIESHRRDWLPGAGVDTAYQSRRSDDSGKATFPYGSHARLLARDTSGLAWSDPAGELDTLRISKAASVTGTVLAPSAGSYLAIPGTSITVALSGNGSYSLDVPAGLGRLALVSGLSTTELPEFQTNAGASTTLLPISSSTAATSPLLAFSSQWLPVETTLRNTAPMRSGDTSFLRVTPGNWASFGPVIPDSTRQGTVRFKFRPGALFHRDSAWTLLGDQGGRLHIGFLKGTLFFQKGQDNLHRIVASSPGMLAQDRWYAIEAAWGPLGMTLSIDNSPVAWSSDSTGYQRDTRTDTNYVLSIGRKESCCMDVLRISRALNGAGDYADLQFLKEQVSPWTDLRPRTCPESQATDLLPRCITSGAVVVTDPLW